MDPMKIGKYIFELRKKNNLTQMQFADKLNVTSQAVSKWENGRGIPDVELLKKISEVFNVNVDSILNGKNNNFNDFKTYIFYVPAFFSLFIILIIFVLNVSVSSDNINISPVSSSNSLFTVDGVAAYSEDKKSIHITSLEVTNEINTKFVIKECALFEQEKNIIVKITDCQNYDVVNIYDSVKADKLSNLLSDVEFHKNNYSSICSDLENANLFITIKLINEDNDVITYDIPLNFDYACTS